MKSPSKITILSIFLVLTVLMLEGATLVNLQTLGMSEELQWFKQWPFSMDDADKLSEELCNFAYNDSHVELVIGLHAEGIQQITSLVAETEGYITNQIHSRSKMQNLVVSIPTTKVKRLLRQVALNDNVDFVEPNWKFTLDVSPNDPEWINQWGPSKTEADVAWNTQKGNHSILVAVVDTGIYNHSDLVANYVALGYDWVNNDSNPTDDNGHGTHVAGIIAAVLNNSRGIAGLAQVRVMAEKGFMSNGVGYSDDLAKAIIHAADQGAHIISCSWGSAQESQLIHEAIKYATDAGALVIAAAGNSASSARHYPAAYEEVIAITATNEKDKLATFSNYGDWVDLAAPGTSIYSTFLWNSYLSMSGTSMACPHVTGVAALVWSQYPSMNNEQVRTQLLNTADDLGTSGFDIYYGHGRVNARKAVAQSIALVDSKILKAPRNTVHFFYKNPKKEISAETSYDAIAGAIIYGLTVNPQKQSFTSDSHLTLESGELNMSVIGDCAVVLVGGPCPQKTVEYYEDTRLTPVRFASNETHYMFLNQENIIVASLGIEAVGSGHEDLFVIEVLMQERNLIAIMYGFSWKGTWASGICFKEAISTNLNSFSDRCYIFHWADIGEENGIPENSEIHQEYSCNGL